MAETTTSRGGGGQYLTFFVGTEEYAAGILRIKEIIEFSGATRVPGTPASVVGVINLRGRVVPVIDLAVKFGASRTVRTQRTCVVIVEIELGGESTVMGLLTDSVSQVIDLPGDAIEPPPAFGTRARPDFLQGVGKNGDRFVLILDLDRLLTDQEINSIVSEPVAV
ncbi:MAG TPA: chemotaxis protein CheW [Thermoanaerobaculia bacterium]|nr:chemotaxis protein CheW [Thermoanaerobaculia bacterium]